ncbi:TIGR02186 family protein [Rhizobium acaciae]|uniref:TIGR02186 family protein n=1 Tax=Rhizobium acaciae TaxID=2989736 RepID=UPI003F95AA98
MPLVVGAIGAGRRGGVADRPCWPRAIFTPSSQWQAFDGTGNFTGLSLLPLCVAAQSTVPVTGREALEIGTSTNEIMIAFGFRGTEITIFGAILRYDQNLLQQKRYNLVVALEGPKRNLTVCKNERVLGVWINTKSVDFSAVLSVYSLSTTDGWLILDSIAVSPAQ